MVPDDLSVSIVVYRPDCAQLIQTLTSLSAAITRLRTEKAPARVSVYLVDNGGLVIDDVIHACLRSGAVHYEVLSGHGNVGYGRGHNLAISQAASRFHLILNPDVDLEEDSLARAFDFFESSRGTGLLTPWVGDRWRQQQYLCRRYPALLDLLVRGFLPGAWQARFADRIAYYEMRDLINDCDVVWDPPIVSGCFMLFRTDVLQELGGFEPRYFLYFEDYDLSLRAHKVARVAYVPSVRVLHHGGGASRKGWAHIRMFVASAFKFFNRFGWKWF